MDRAHEEKPSVSSTLKWEDVTLPDGLSEAELDELILSTLSSRWQKTAKVIVRTLEICADRAVPLDAEVVGARIVALVLAQNIEAAGDPSMWRHSELRLPLRE